MSLETILQEINKIFIDVLDNEDVQLQPSTTAKDIEGWDSLSHIQLIHAIEKRFKVRFNTAEIIKWKNVGEICEAVERQQGK